MIGLGVCVISSSYDYLCSGGLSASAGYLRSGVLSASDGLPL